MYFGAGFKRPKKFPNKYVIEKRAEFKRLIRLYRKNLEKQVIYDMETKHPAR